MRRSLGWSACFSLVMIPFAARATPEDKTLTERAPMQEVGALSVLAGYPDGLGVALSLRLIPYVELEAGLSNLTNNQWNPGLGGFVQAGPAFRLVDTRGHDGHGFTVTVAPLLAGVRWRDDPDLPTTSLAIALTIRGEATAWLGSRLGLQAAFEGGADLWVNQPPAFVDAIDVRASVGIAF